MTDKQTDSVAGKETVKSAHQSYISNNVSCASAIFVMEEGAGIYSDILYKEKPVSHHKKMDTGHRAKQFAPFDALKSVDFKVPS